MEMNDLPHDAHASRFSIRAMYEHIERAAEYLTENDRRIVRAYLDGGALTTVDPKDAKHIRRSYEKCLERLSSRESMWLVNNKDHLDPDVFSYGVIYFIRGVPKAHICRSGIKPTLLNFYLESITKQALSTSD